MYILEDSMCIGVAMRVSLGLSSVWSLNAVGVH